MIVLKTLEEVEMMAQASKIVAEAHQVLKKEVRPGVTTLFLDSIAEEFIRGHGGVPAFKGYRNYPKTLCVAVNDEVVHGIPSTRVLKEGDIIGLDLGAIVHGFYGDGAVTVPVGPVPDQVSTLMRVTEEAMMKGIEQGAHASQACRYSRCIDAFSLEAHHSTRIPLSFFESRQVGI